jgi:ubiquinone/menaquinone biosynthesis C-methylase UbiE
MSATIETEAPGGIRHAVLRCAACQGSLRVEETAWSCTSCGATGRSTLGIPDLRPSPKVEGSDEIAELTAAFPTASFSDLVKIRVPYFSTDDPMLTSHYAAYREDSLARGARYYAMAMQRLRETVGEPGGRIAVVLGCGAGSCTLAVAAAFDTVIAVDPGLADLILARKACEEHGCRNVVLVQGYAQHLPLADGIVDLVISEDVIEHVFDLESTMAESARVLAPGGCVVGNSANRFSVLRPEPHVKLWGVGFLPRPWMGRYVNWRRGYRGYDTNTYLPSYRELLGAVRRNFGSNGRIVFPRVAAWDFPKSIDRMVQRIERVPPVAGLVLSVFPMHLVVGRKERGSTARK